MKYAGLTDKKDGIDGIDLGVIDTWQYALTHMAFARISQLHRREAARATERGWWQFVCFIDDLDPKPGRWPSVAPPPGDWTAVKAAIQHLYQVGGTSNE